MVELTSAEYEALCLALETRAKLRKKVKSNKLTLAEKLVIISQIKGLDEMIRARGLSVNDEKYK